MIPFAPRRALIECGCSPLAEDSRIGTTQNFLRTLSGFASGSNRGFYFQVVLVEFAFTTLTPNHRNKISLCFPAPNVSATKIIRDRLGNEITLPVFLFYVLVNRSHFPPMQENENRIEWLSCLPSRCRGLAHELLIAKQYAENFDYESHSLLHPITIPSSVDEDRLMCPQSEIERLLTTVEVEQGVGLTSVAAFNLALDTVALEAYFHSWLADRAVDKDCVTRMTLDYLQTEFRTGQYTVLPTLLESCELPFRPGSLSVDDFGRCFSSSNPRFRDFAARIESIYPTVEMETLNFALKKYLRI